MFCEHARGPAFLLTDKDWAELASLLRSLAEESSGSGSHPLGWFVSHTKGSAALTEADLDILRATARRKPDSSFEILRGKSQEPFKTRFRFQHCAI